MPRWLHWKNYQTFKEGLTTILHNPFQKLEEKATILNTFNESSNSLVPKARKDSTKNKQQKPYRPICLMNTKAKFLNKISIHKIQ